MHPASKNSHFKAFHFIILFVSLLIISFPRFNQQDIGPIKKFTGEPFDEFKAKGYFLLGDAPHYIELVKYFKGDIAQKSLHVPFAYRPLVPLLCVLLPFEPLTSINLLNLVWLSGSVILLYQILGLLNFSAQYSLAGCYMFVVSFGIFWYSTTGFIDPGFIFVLLLGLYFILTKNDAGLFITLFFGVLLKETSVILIPVYGFSKYYRKEKFALKIVFLVLTALLPVIAVRMLMADVIPRQMLPRLDNLMSNLGSYKGLTALFLTLGIPGLLSLQYFIFVRRKSGFSAGNRELYPAVVLYLSSLGLLLLSFFIAHADGRMALPLFVSSIPFALLTIEYYKNSDNKRISAK